MPLPDALPGAWPDGAPGFSPTVMHPPFQVMTNHYRIQFVLPVAREAVFDYLADARHLDALTPPWLRFDVRTPMPVEMRVGTVIDYRLRWRGVPLAWRSEIVEWAPRERFTYEQRRGPYRRFRHVHRFEETADGTRVTDEVDWDVWGVRLLRRRVNADLETIFRGRVRRLATTLGVNPSTTEVHSLARVGENRLAP